MPEFNWFYLLAAILMGLSILTGYIGSQITSDKSDQRIEGKLDDLKTELKEAIEQPDSAEKTEKIEKVNEEYQALADEYFQKRDVLGAKERVRIAQEEAKKAERDNVAQAYLRSIARHAKDIALAYNEAAGREVITVLDETNQRDPHPYILLKFAKEAFWVIQPSTIIIDNEPGSLEFARVEFPYGDVSYEKMLQTRDLITLNVQDEVFSVEVHPYASDAIKVNVTDQMIKLGQRLDQIEPTGKKLVQKIVEYQLLPKTE